jgi:hypothetical protein
VQPYQSAHASRKQIQMESLTRTSGRADPVSPSEMAGYPEQYHVGIVSRAFPQRTVCVKPALGSDFHPMAPHLPRSEEDPYRDHSHRSPHNILTASHSRTSCSTISMQCSFHSLYWLQTGVDVHDAPSLLFDRGGRRRDQEGATQGLSTRRKERDGDRGPGTSTEARDCTERKPKYIRGSGAL